MQFLYKQFFPFLVGLPHDKIPSSLANFRLLKLVHWQFLVEMLVRCQDLVLDISASLIYCCRADLGLTCIPLRKPPDLVLGSRKVLMDSFELVRHFQAWLGLRMGLWGCSLTLTLECCSTSDTVYPIFFP